MRYCTAFREVLSSFGPLTVNFFECLGVRLTLGANLAQYNKKKL